MSSLNYAVLEIDSSRMVRTELAFREERGKGERTKTVDELGVGVERRRERWWGTMEREIAERMNDDSESRSD